MTVGKMTRQRARRRAEQTRAEQAAERDRERAAEHDTAKIAGLVPVTTADLLQTVEAGHAVAGGR